MNKKGFDANQLFIYITAVVVVGFVMIFGFKVIQQFVSTEKDLGELKVQDNLERIVAQVRNDHGSQRFVDLRVPGSFRAICFFDYTSIRSGGGGCGTPTEFGSKPAWFVCESSLDEGAQENNVVLIKADGSIGKPFFVEGLRVQTDDDAPDRRDAQSLCVEAYQTRFRLEGFRRDAYVSHPQVTS